MPQITCLAVQLSLLVTPPAAKARDAFTIAQRIAHLDEAQQDLRNISLFWTSQRESTEGFVDFESKQIAALRRVA